MKRAFLFVVAMVVGPLAAADTPDTCPAPHTGRYINYDHYYAFTVPAGYSGTWQSPCAWDQELSDCICIGSHGLYISLSAMAAINVFSFYPDTEENTTAQILKSAVTFQRDAALKMAGSITRPQSISVNGTKGVRLVLKWRDTKSKVAMKKVTYLLVTTSNDKQDPKAELVLSLIAPEAEFVDRQQLFDKMLKTFSWQPPWPPSK